MFRSQWKEKRPGLCSWLFVVISYHQWWYTSTHTHVLYWNTVHNEHQFFVCVWKYEYLPFLCELSPSQKPPWTSEGHTLMTETSMNQWGTHSHNRNLHEPVRDTLSSCINKHHNRLSLSQLLTPPAVITCSKVMKAGSVRGWELVTDCDYCVCFSLTNIWSTQLLEDIPNSCC